MDKLNDIKRDKIKSRIANRYQQGERLRDLHENGSSGAPFSSATAKFDMEPIASINQSYGEKSNASEPARVDSVSETLPANTNKKKSEISKSTNSGKPIKPDKTNKLIAQDKSDMSIKPDKAGGAVKAGMSDISVKRDSSDKSIKHKNSTKPTIASEAKRNNPTNKKLDASFAREARGISHEQRRRKQMLRDIGKVLCVLLSFLLLFAAFSVIKRYTTVKSISVSGSKLYSQAQLLSLSGISAGESIFACNESAIRNTMDSIANIHTKSVKKVYPSHIDIVVDDVFARAAIRDGNGRFTIISSDGYVLSLDEELTDDLIEVRGLSGAGFVPGVYIDESLHNIRTVGTLELIKAIDEREYSNQIKYIDISGVACVEIGFEHGYTAVLGAITGACENLDIAMRAYERFLPIYPAGGVINVFNGSSTVDFTPNLP